MKKLLRGMTLLLAITAIGCTSNKSEKTMDATETDTTCVSDSANVQGESTLLGTFEGTIPAASCPGIKVTLTLNADNSFDLVEDYIDNEKFTSKGDYTFENNILCTITEQQDTTFYKVDGDKLKMLNSELQEATGELADQYVLNKKM